VGDVTSTRSFEVLQDPRIELDAAEAVERFELARRVSDTISEIHRELARSRDVREQVEATLARLEDAGDVDESLRDQGKAIGEALQAQENLLHQSKAEVGQDILNHPPQIDNQLVFLQGVVEQAWVRPTVGSRQRYEDLRAALDGILGAIHAVYDGSLADFNQGVATLEPAPVMVKKEVGY
jgi:hypothetical protein